MRSKDEKDCLYLYLKEVTKIPLLTAEEEIELAKRNAEGDSMARERLIRGNLRYVISLAKNFQGNGLPLSDLISEGNIGLINAVERYDYKKGFRFTTYASWRIKQRIIKAIEITSRTIRFPAQICSLLYQVKIGEKYGLSIKEISERVNVPVKKIEYLLKLGEVRSLDSFIDDEKDKTFEKFLEDKRDLPEEEEPRFNGKDLASIISEGLNARQAKVIKMRFGLEGSKKYTLEGAGEVMGVSGERIRQIEEKAIIKIKKKINEEELKNELYSKWEEKL
jgi:RNA polymerase primary sigma factor